jgi:DNA (cytosine-5)-methyltransferase 1
VTVTIGSLCSGYAGLDLAVEQITGGTTVWHCEYEDAPSKLLALRFPDVPNWHDLTTLAWADQPVRIVTGGYPCQPFSAAGRRLGTADPRHLFPYIARGLKRIRPELFLGENVRAHLSLGFDVVLAALHRIGYDVRWTTLPASAVGAPHGRARLWFAARAREAGGWPAPTGHPTAYAERSSYGEDEWVSPADGLFGSTPAPRPGTAGVMVDGVRWDTDADLGPSAVLLPTPRSSDTNGAGSHGDGGLDLRTAVSLLLTPRATDGTKGGPNQRGSSGDLMLPSAVQHLLPTPTVGDSRNSRNSTAGRSPDAGPHAVGDTLCDLVHDGRANAAAWGPYAAAVARWEALTHPAPPPTEQGRNGPRLSPLFVEWMQGLPAGWVTDVPNLGRNPQLTMLGNGVVPQCAAVAYTILGVPAVLR